MTPNQEQKYRNQKMTFLNLRMKTCAGCRRVRSEAQYAKDSSYCKQCVLRGNVK